MVCEMGLTPQSDLRPHDDGLIGSATSLRGNAAIRERIWRPQSVSICSRSVENISSSSQESATWGFFASRGSLSR